MKYDKETVDTICKYIREGCTQLDAAIHAGISESCFYDWKKNKKQFSEDIKKARVKNKHIHELNIQKAGAKSWQASAWWLERTDPENYALKIKKEYTGKDGAPIQSEHLIRINQEELRRQIKQIEESV